MRRVEIVNTRVYDVPDDLFKREFPDEYEWEVVRGELDDEEFFKESVYVMLNDIADLHGIHERRDLSDTDVVIR